MSNVLIGIIGVILFIGLALAGALFLGQRFQQSSSLSKASAVSSIIAQSVNALQLYNTQEPDAPLMVGYWTNLTDRGYMKSRPSTVYVRGENGDTSVVLPVYMVVSSNNEADLASDDVCVAFAQQNGMQTSSTVQSLANAPAGAHAGCFKASQAWGDQAAGTYLYFHRL